MKTVTDFAQFGCDETSASRSISGVLGIIAVSFKGDLGHETLHQWLAEHDDFPDTLFFNLGGDQCTFILRGRMVGTESTEIGPGVTAIHGDKINLSLFEGTEQNWYLCDDPGVGILRMPPWMQSLVSSGTILQEVAA